MEWVLGNILLHYGVIPFPSNEPLGVVDGSSWIKQVFAPSPMSLCSSVNATTEGVVLFPMLLAMTSGHPFWKIATQELVVPRSIPIDAFGFSMAYL